MISYLQPSLQQFSIVYDLFSPLLFQFTWSRCRILLPLLKGSEEGKGLGGREEAKEGHTQTTRDAFSVRRHLERDMEGGQYLQQWKQLTITLLDILILKNGPRNIFHVKAFLFIFLLLPPFVLSHNLPYLYAEYSILPFLVGRGCSTFQILLWNFSFYFCMTPARSFPKHYLKEILVPAINMILNKHAHVPQMHMHKSVPTYIHSFACVSSFRHTDTDHTHILLCVTLLHNSHSLANDLIL